MSNSNEDKIPIGKLLYSETSGGDIVYKYLEINLKDGVKVNPEDIITLDMIEPYESEAVRKVAEYISDYLYPEHVDDLRSWSVEEAKKIVALVHEAEDADE